MKKILVISAMVAAFCVSGLAVDGGTLFKKCMACHGAKAEKSYLNKIPVLTSINKEERLKDMKAYKAGTLNKFKMGPVMKGQMAPMSEEDMAAVNEYIETLK